MLRNNFVRTLRVANVQQSRGFSSSFIRLYASAFEIPATQKAVIFESNGGKLEYKDIPVPKPKPNEILINVKYSGVCHTDLHAWKGDWPLATKLPLVGGHEGAGVVVALGSAVTNFKVGDLAGIKWLNGSCQSCEFCENGNESNCPHADLSGYTHDGSFQQYATADAIQAAKIPKGTDLANVAPILCAGVTVYKALKTANLQPGHWVAISGAGGGLGSLAVQYANRSKVSKITATSKAVKEQKVKKVKKVIKKSKSANATIDIPTKPIQLQAPESIELKEEFIERYSSDFIDGLKHILKIDGTLYDVATSNEYPSFYKSEIDDYRKLIEKYEKENEQDLLKQYFFRFLSQSIIGQQLSGKSAAAIKLRVVNRFKELNPDSEYPGPDFFLEMSVEDLSALGLGTRKSQYLKSLSIFFVTNDSTLCDFFLNSDVNDIREKLIEIKGLGPWTISMFLLFGLKKMNIFDTSDLGIARGSSIYFRQRETVFKELKSIIMITSDDKCRWTKSKSKKKWTPVHEKYMLENANRFNPYRSVLMLILWQISHTFVDALK